jgi:serine/threonine protein kinase/Tol biopolymer transport system component
MSMIGETLGSFQIISQLGKGGMGEVYRATDQKLGRDVAIKVLPEEFATDTDRVARFQREAKVLASLNHPNIAAIHGLEGFESTGFLVLELVEGPTLADRIKAGPIPVEESLKLALQIAEGLEAAHEKGVIHRDLKPSNIKVTPEGKVKILDFGLAKAYAGEPEEPSLSASPTLSNLATQQGVILGTAAYMSPEQARGKNVDRRADIWAFGCLLYEMLTGEAAFQGEDVTEILASVVKGGANLDLLPANIHPRVREIITRCLQKDLKKRYSGITDARYEIEQALADPRGVLVQPVTPAKYRRQLRVGIAWIAAAVVLSLIIGGVAVWKLKPSEPRPIGRFFHELSEGQRFAEPTQERAFALSPDGTQLVYATTEGIYLRSMAELDARLISGTKENPGKPFFSPDGKWIGYVSGVDGKLKKISINGGAPIPIAQVSSVGFLNWGADDAIVYCTQGSGNIMKVSANGGNPEVLIEGKGLGCYAPQILPDGKTVIFTVDPPPYKIMVQSLKSGERKELVAGDTAQYLSTGHVVFALDNNLFAIPFDLDSLSSTGGPVSVVEGVWRAGGAPQYAVSDGGTLAYVPGTGTGSASSENALVWVDRNGKEEPITIPANVYETPRISPDGKRVALGVGPTQNEDVWVWDFGLKTLTRLTFDSGEDGYPVWTPDGKRIAFHTHQKDARGSIYWKAADGTGEDEAVGSYPGSEIFPCSWSGDGKTLLVTAGYAGTAIDIGAQSTEGDKQYKLLLKEGYSEAQPHISRDGRWIAYASNESAQTQIYVRPFPELNKGRWQISANGGESPLWSPDGRELFYRNGDAVVAVPVKTDPVFSREAAKILFRGTYASSWPFDAWDIHPDGKRFLMIKQTAANTAATGSPRINIVLNWLEELKQRVPVK